MLIKTMNIQNHPEKNETRVSTTQTVKVFLIGSNLLREGLFSLLSNTRQIEIIGGSEYSSNGISEEIVRLRPQVIIHGINPGKDDSLLIETIKKNLPDVYYITLGTTSDLMYRIRYNALGVNHVLDQQNGLGQVTKILLSMPKTR